MNETGSKGYGVDKAIAVVHVSGPVRELQKVWEWRV
jgi:hypothetical protein